MRRDELEHIVRAAGELLGEEHVYVFGSQSILGAFPDGLPRGAVASSELDIAAFEDPTGEKADLIAGSLGEMSDFDERFHYYADGVNLSTPRLPDGWRERLVPVRNGNTNGVTAWCLDPTDLCVAKLLAARGKDFEFVHSLIVSGHVRPAAILNRLLATKASPPEQEHVLLWLVSVQRPHHDRRYTRAIREVEARLGTSPPLQRDEPPRSATPRRRAVPRISSACGAWMPVARSYCALPPGHAGHHRSSR